MWISGGCVCIILFVLNFFDSSGWFFFFKISVIKLYGFSIR